MSGPSSEPTPATARWRRPVQRSNSASSLVVVSNRLPFVAERGPEGTRFRRASGGLVAALDPALEQRGGVWVGWPGAELHPDQGNIPSGPSGVRYRAVTLTSRDAAAYYGGFANRTLWPLFHYFVNRTHIDGTTWRAYDRVNERFAVAAAEESQPGDIVWVHDYQLLRVPHYLRHTAAGRKIAFFLHVPFPAYDVFRVLPWCRALLRGVLAADLVGVHVGEYVRHILECAERLLGCDVDRDAGLVQFDGRHVTVGAFPIGIDVAGTEAWAAAAPVTPTADRPAQVIGLDRLDYTKGIPERLLAFERFLERYPAFHGRVEFTQVVVPSRELVEEYRALKRDLDEAVGRINGRFSDAGWTPIRYRVRSLSPKELGGFYRDADVALVTPLRDGMNLVAKEYVASQVDRAGVLVLSELAGAAEELQEALLVNPLDPDAVADMLHRALTLPADERRARMSALRDRVRGNTVHAWVDGVLAAADQASARAAADDPSVVERLERRLGPWLRERPEVALFFDYDGTLTPLAEEPEQATLPAATRQALEAAARAAHVQLVIVSGRALSDITQLVGVPSITYVGNHGFEIEGPGMSYRHPRVADYLERVQHASEQLAALQVPGARVEAKGATLSYHTRHVADEIRDLVERQAHTVLRHAGLAVGRGKRVIEGRPPLGWHKGSAVLHVLRERNGADWPGRVRALYVGDDVTDEDAFRSLRGIGRSVVVGRAAGSSPSQADYALPDPAAVGQLLRWLAAGGFQGERTRARS